MSGGGAWGFLSDSGYCLEGYDAIDKHTVRHIFNGCFLFSQLPWIGQNVPYIVVPLGNLEGVWGISE